VEALTGDFAGNLDHVALVARSGLDVYAHNVETVEALTPFVRDRRATFRQSLSVLAKAKAEGVRVTKTSIMLGVGETEEQVLAALKELRNVDVDVVTFGQYMRPTKKHMKVHRYVEPVEFERWKKVAEDMGFLYVASGPLVRSSYKVSGRDEPASYGTNCITGWRTFHRECTTRQGSKGTSSGLRARSVRVGVFVNYQYISVRILAYHSHL
jgi:lipoate synthase